jgi:hypothetical protein
MEYTKKKGGRKKKKKKKKKKLVFKPFSSHFQAIFPPKHSRERQFQMLRCKRSRQIARHEPKDARKHPVVHGTREGAGIVFGARGRELGAPGSNHFINKKNIVFFRV